MFDAHTIRIQFKYQDEFELALKSLEAAMKHTDAKEILSADSVRHIQALLSAVKEVE